MVAFNDDLIMISRWLHYLITVAYYFLNHYSSINYCCRLIFCTYDYKYFDNISFQNEANGQGVTPELHNEWKKSRMCARECTAFQYSTNALYNDMYQS